MSRLTIRNEQAHGSDVTFEATLASLPIDFAPATEGEPSDVVRISGAQGWARRAELAISDGARAVLVVRPTADDSESLTSLLRVRAEKGAVLDVSEPYAGDPALSLHGSEISSSLTDQTLIYITELAPEPEVARTVLSVLRTLRALGRPLTEVTVRRDGSTLSVAGRAETTIVRAHVTSSQVRPVTRIESTGVARTVDIRLFGDDDARPARVQITDASAQRTLPTVFETAERAAWLRIATSLEEPGASSSEIVSGLVADIQVAADAAFAMREGNR